MSNEPAVPEPTSEWTCDCGAPMARFPGEGDQQCTDCGQWFNASGQRLRDDWLSNPSILDDEIGDLDGYEIAHAEDD